MRHFLLLGLFALQPSGLGAQEPAARSLPSDAVRMTSAQISLYNADLAPTDPQFIRCIRSEAPGSLVKRRTCRTNADWETRASAASDEARAIVDNIQTRGFSVSEEPAGSLVPLTPN